MAEKPAQKFEDLDMCKKSHALVLRMYKLTRDFPKEEIYGLTAQMRRAATSVPANIAEAFKQRHRPDKARVLNIAQGSLEELRYHFILSRDLEYLPSSTRGDEVEDVALNSDS
jgi:four helix bundle protein